MFLVSKCCSEVMAARKEEKDSEEKTVRKGWQGKDRLPYKELG